MSDHPERKESENDFTQSEPKLNQEESAPNDVDARYQQTTEKLIALSKSRNGLQKRQEVLTESRRDLAQQQDVLDAEWKRYRHEFDAALKVLTSF